MNRTKRIACLIIALNPYGPSGPNMATSGGYFEGYY